MKVYIAARYERRQEMATVWGHLRGVGFGVTSRWIDFEDSVPASMEPAFRSVCATMDMDDVRRADAILLFSEPEGATRGGRHVEFGIALALGKRCIVVGEAENIFHHLPDVVCVKDLDAAIFVLQGGMEAYAGAFAVEGQPRVV